ncbi:MAG: protoporphyrinogen oxidase [Ornithinimicrobium sp.]|uniref:protoporphyrinogen oxidase n=1 Tax=Ornithinimicrobium sp. TaxID=1977084 RepID=UPI0026E0CA31|nr:protoporphyrinogen oxidase [Ornithinimicrobium sp.]MDO5740092.1 protoporphyrinogen oxidase [Ornithinimicrobium sp.]
MPTARPPAAPTYLVVGAGISGLAAAEELLRLQPSAQVTILESTDRVGGKIRGATVAGRSVDVGAEAFLVRRPEALDLIERAGLSDQLVHPTAASAQVWSRGHLHPLPRRTFMGVPAETASLLGLLTQEEVDRVRAETTPTLEAADTSVAELVTQRLGPAVTQRLVEPLLGGVYAGHAELLSARACLPRLLAVAQRGGSLLEAVAAMLPPPTDTAHASAPDPVFATVRGGLHQLPGTLAQRLVAQGVTIVTDTTVREVHLLPAGGYELVTGPRPSPTTYRADQLVLAVPAAPAARLLAHITPEASRLLGTVETASMGVVTLALPSADLGHIPGSGFLVPPVEGRTVKAATFSANKWDWVRETGLGAGPDGTDLTYLRASVGRHREESTLQVSDDDLVAACLTDLGAAMGRRLPSPVDVHVHRWGGALPQYAVGHVDLVASVRAAVDAVPGLGVCGAVFEGVGIPACIGAARRSAAQVLARR